MSPRKLIALIEADRDIEDANLSRLAYVLKTGSLPSRDNGFDEEGALDALRFF